MDTEDRRLPKVAGNEADPRDHIAMPIGPTVGVSPVTTIAATAQEGVAVTQGRTAAVPETAVAEPARDDVALATTRARSRMPEWFAIVWRDRKSVV